MNQKIGVLLGIGSWIIGSANLMIPSRLSLVIGVFCISVGTHVIMSRK